MMPLFMLFPRAKKHHNYLKDKEKRDFFSFGTAIALLLLTEKRNGDDHDESDDPGLD